MTQIAVFVLFSGRKQTQNRKLEVNYDPKRTDKIADLLLS